MQCIVFEVSHKKYCINISKVNGIHEIVEFTQIPNSPEFIEGLINLRGMIIPVINLAVKFGYEKSVVNSMSRIINLHIGDDLIGILVDGVHQVVTIDDLDIENPPNIIKGKNREYISQIAKLNEEIAIVLDTDKILTSDEMKLLVDIAQ